MMLKTVDWQWHLNIKDKMISEPSILRIRGLTSCFFMNLCDFYCHRKENRAMPSSWDEWFWNLHIQIEQFFKERTEGLLANRNFWNINWFCNGNICAKWDCWKALLIMLVSCFCNFQSRDPWLSKHCVTSLKHNLLMSGYRNDSPVNVN
jgi:hypothetical protein